MTEKTVIVTGAGAGIGRATVLGLANSGAHVVVSARSEGSAGPVLEQLKQLGGKGETLIMDLASPDSTREAVARFRDKHERVDVLINNAGVWAGERKTTGEGYEVTWGVNVLAPFRLTHLLADALRQGEGRVINLSSVQHYKGDIFWDDLQLERAYKGVKAYRQSKLAITMLSAEHAVRDDGLKVNAVHPGVAGTDLFRNFPAFIRFWINLLMSTPEKCAQPSLMLATKPEHSKTTGKFFHQLKEREPHKLVKDEAARKRLWDVLLEQAKLPE